MGRIEVPVAPGENLRTRYRFAEFIDAGAVELVQPNVVRVGGITPFLDIAGLAADRGVELAPHLLLELSAQLALALPGAHLVEAVEDASFEELGALAEPSPVAVAGATVSTTGRPGLGVRFTSEQPGAAASARPTEEP
ncbi:MULTISPECIES: enolase C-terminal domain-like protein [unclassified Agromyces]|uniref:enolase C-terminal domain-like protein n=1 Tax=unclassified Agromyces TaxID=2639701 RepID=UPI0030148571